MQVEDAQQVVIMLYLKCRRMILTRDTYLCITSKNGTEVTRVDRWIHEKKKHK